MGEKREKIETSLHSMPCEDDSKELVSSNLITNNIQKTIEHTMEENHFYLPDSLFEDFKDDDTQYELFPNYSLFEYNKVDKQVKVGEDAALYGQWSRIGQDFSSFYNYSLFALTAPTHVLEENTIEVNVNMQNEESGEGNKEHDNVTQPNETIIPSELQGFHNDNLASFSLEGVLDWLCPIALLIALEIQINFER